MRRAPVGTLPRRCACLLPRAVCLGSATALAFFAGGFNDRSRHIALIVTAAALLLTAFLARRPLPQGWPARVVLASLGLFCGLTAISASWAPLGYRPPTTPSASCSTSSS